MSDMIKVEAVAYGATVSDRLAWKGDDADAPNPGDELGWGWPMMRPASVWEDSPQYVPVPAALWGDYVGTTYTRANFVGLSEDYPDTFVTLGYGGHDGQSLWLRVGQEIPESLHEVLTGMVDYPIYDEDRLSKIEQEVEVDDVQYWVMDWSDEDHDDDDLLALAYWNLRESGALAWQAETATGGTVYAAILDADQSKRVEDLDRWDSVDVLIRDEYDRIKEHAEPFKA